MKNLFVTIWKLRTGSIVALLFASFFALTAIAGPGEADSKLTAAAKEHRTRLNFDGDTFTGPALDQLLNRARGAQFFLIGEEHGIAENPQLAAQLFATLVDDGYEKLVIEISPPMASVLDEATKSNGIEGIRDLYATPGGEPAFFGMREEVEMLAAVRAAVAGSDDVFWGVDYEVASDRVLLRKLQAASPPASAELPLDALVAASAASWAQYEETGNPGFIFSFAGDPAMVAAVRDAWPGADDQALLLLETLESTLEINQLWTQGRGWESNTRRASFMRTNFLHYWQAAIENEPAPKVMAKLGATHMVRGRNSTGTFDLGTLLPEIAAIDGNRAFSVLVLPGRDSMTAVLNPTNWTFEPKPAKDHYAKGIDALTDAAYADAFTLIDLVALRPIVGSREKIHGSELLRIVHGFDMLLVMSGSTASSELEHGQERQ